MSAVCPGPQFFGPAKELMRLRFRRVEKELSSSSGTLFPFERRFFARHAIFCLIFILLYLFLNEPEVIMLSQLGYSVWYPATGLILAVMLGISPWYFPLTVLAGALPEIGIYHQPILSWSGLATPVLGSGSYFAAALLLRGPLKIDLALRRRRDVVLYIAVTLGAAVFATVSGTACLAADGTIPWAQYWNSAWAWYVGDVVGLVGFAPFLLIHVLPRVLRMLSPFPATIQKGHRGKTKTEQTKLRDVAEVVGQFGSMFLVLWIMFGPVMGYRQLYYLAVVPIIWIAMRHGIQRVVTGLLFFNFSLVAALRLYPVTENSLIKVGLLMLTLSGTGLIVGAGVHA